MLTCLLGCYSNCRKVSTYVYMHFYCHYTYLCFKWGGGRLFKAISVFEDIALELVDIPKTVWNKHPLPSNNTAIPWINRDTPFFHLLFRPRVARCFLDIAQVRGTCFEQLFGCCCFQGIHSTHGGQWLILFLTCQWYNGEHGMSVLLSGCTIFPPMCTMVSWNLSYANKVPLCLSLWKR